MIQIILDKHPTHIKLSKEKSVKINGQNIYNGKLHYFSRAKIMDSMHNFIIDSLREQQIQPIEGRFFIEYVFYLPVNFGSLRKTKKGYSFHDASETYIPNWDIDNVSYPWIKSFADSLKIYGVIPEDNVSIIHGYSVKVIFCKSIEDRKIVINILK